MRLSIEVSPEQHQRLKASAALQELEGFLKPRIEAANKGDFSSKSVDDIFDEVEQEENTEK